MRVSVGARRVNREDDPNWNGHPMEGGGGRCVGMGVAIERLCTDKLAVFDLEPRLLAVRSGFDRLEPESSPTHNRHAPSLSDHPKKHENSVSYSLESPLHSKVTNWVHCLRWVFVRCVISQSYAHPIHPFPSRPRPGADLRKHSTDQPDN